MKSEMPKTSNHVIAATTDVGQLRARVAELLAEVEALQEQISYDVQTDVATAEARADTLRQQLSEAHRVIEAVRAAAGESQKLVLQEGTGLALTHTRNIANRHLKPGFWKHGVQKPDMWTDPEWDATLVEVQALRDRLGYPV